jgi:hypothetical protein
MKHYQTPLFDVEAFTHYNPAWDETDIAPQHNTTVLEQVTPNTQQPSNRDYHVLEQASTDTNQSAPEQCHWVEKYKVTRYGKEHYYYRYIWMSGRKLHHVHIPGGNVRSQLAIERKAAVENAIAAGKLPFEIEKLIRDRRND